ncbi:MAG: respiratory nitrate reductase subunit gamma [Thermoleophilia bacterium]|nr:respiratory nitrate reductase subunit gamma [Thermoleophilia bacterium]
MSRVDLFLWVALPYLCVAVFVVGHVWRHRRGQLTWTTRSTQLLESRLLRIGSPLFHLGILAAVGGHVLGILVPRGWTEAIGIQEHAYHWIAIVAGVAAGTAIVLGLAILLYRRVAVPRVRHTTTRSDLVVLPLLVLVIGGGMLVTVWGTAIDEYPYRTTVSPWFRGIFGFAPEADLMAGAPFVFQLHAVSSWLLFAVWPFSRLVHAWSFPLGYLRRSHILYRSRTPRAALARNRALDGRRRG